MSDKGRQVQCEVLNRFGSYQIIRLIDGAAGECKWAKVETKRSKNGSYETETFLLYFAAAILFIVFLRSELLLLILIGENLYEILLLKVK